jgi:hypothetical protein
MLSRALPNSRWLPQVTGTMSSAECWGGGVLYLLLSGVTHLRGPKFISRNQYEITKSTAKKDVCPLEGISAHLGQKSLPEGENFNCSVICIVVFFEMDLYVMIFVKIV